MPNLFSRRSIPGVPIPEVCGRHFPARAIDVELCRRWISLGADISCAEGSVPEVFVRKQMFSRARANAFRVLSHLKESFFDITGADTESEWRILRGIEKTMNRYRSLASLRRSPPKLRATTPNLFVR